LEFVDEFIDSIAATACKTAKLRESKTINLKDIQLILERHWSIRIPDSSAVKSAVASSTRLRLTTTR
jgi:transcription initiation factor TFIID subunit 12